MLCVSNGIKKEKCLFLFFVAPKASVLRCNIFKVKVVPEHFTAIWQHDWSNIG